MLYRERGKLYQAVLHLYLLFQFFYDRAVVPIQQKQPAFRRVCFDADRLIPDDSANRHMTIRLNPLTLLSIGHQSFQLLHQPWRDSDRQLHFKFADEDHRRCVEPFRIRLDC